MKLDYRQMRRLYLGGTVAFPRPYPSCGILSFESGNSHYAARGTAKGKFRVIVQQYSEPDWVLDRAIRQEDVAAIFIPGTRKANGEFRISRESMVDDFETGEWFLD